MAWFSGVRASGSRSPYCWAKQNTGFSLHGPWIQFAPISTILSPREEKYRLEVLEKMVIVKLCYYLQQGAYFMYFLTLSVCLFVLNGYPRDLEEGHGPRTFSPISQRIIHGTWFKKKKIWFIKGTDVYECAMWSSSTGFKETVGSWLWEALYCILAPLQLFYCCLLTTGLFKWKDSCIIIKALSW